jgi:hypothetical protein
VKKLLIIFAVFFCVPIHVLAQVPGGWEKHVVCTKCSFDYYTNTPYTGKLVFSDAYHGMLVGDDDRDYDVFDTTEGSTSRVYITSDGGVTWTKHAARNSVLWDLEGLKYITPDFAAGFYSYGTVYTTDQGFHWHFIHGRNPQYQFLSGIVYSPSTFYELSTPNINNFYPGDSPAFVESSLDTGNTFQLISNTFAAGNAHFEAAVMHDSMNIWALISDSVSSNTSCIKTTDGGLHWNRSFPTDTTDGKTLVFSNQYFGNEEPGSFYLRNSTVIDRSHKYVISQFDFLFTTDGGASWQADSSHHGRLPFLTSSGKNKLWGFIGTRDQHYHYHCDTLAYSPNNGKNWYYDTESIKGDSVVFMTWKDSTHGYIISYKDSTITFAKYIPPLSEVIGKTMPYLAFNLVPSITTGIIHLTSYQAFSGAISVYDVLGRLQMQKALVFSNGEEKDFSLSGLPSGMYFIVYASGGMYNSARIIKE